MQSNSQIRPLLSDTRLRQILGVLWIIDGLLQLQPQMFTMNMVNGVMLVNVNGQPAPIASSLNWIIAMTTQYLTQVNWTITIIQVIIGVGLLVGWRVKWFYALSITWALFVWYGGEGMSLLLTGKASALSGAPGSVLFYALLAIALWPRSTSGSAKSQSDGAPRQQRALLSRAALRWFLAGYWLLAALLQLQPNWWQPEQISQSIASMTNPGTLSGVIIDPTLRWLSTITSGIEGPLNMALIVVFVALASGIALVKTEHIRPWLVASIVISVILWWFAQSLGMILTGMSTDPNSGPLVILLALSCWPLLRRAPIAEERKPSSNAPRGTELSQSRT
ncbi:MAG: hypothetical protein WCD86_16435 [Ktedonobacteraceae bacterium]